MDKTEDTNFHTTHPPEGSELNGKDASFRGAPLISNPRTLQRMRLPNGATVPLPIQRP